MVNKNRHNLLFPHKKDTSTSHDYTSIITTFSNEHLKIRQICNKYWHTLTSDPAKGPFVPPTPLVTFRQAASVGDLLVKSEFKCSKRGDPCNTLGTFPWGSCAHCCYMDTRKSIRLPNGWTFVSKHFANCQSTLVIYLLQCECGCYYIGKNHTKIMEKDLPSYISQ